jgi:hypothetical protein
VNVLAEQCATCIFRARHVPHGYERLAPDRIPDGIAAREAFEADVLPTLTEIHGGDLRPEDPEYGRAYAVFMRGWSASYWRGAAVGGAEVRRGMER